MAGDMLKKIMQFQKLLDLKTSDVTSSHLRLIADTLNFDIAPDKLQEVTTLINSDDEDQMAMWAAEPANLEIFRKLRNQQRVTELVQCPHCADMSVYDVNEIAEVNPHVWCRHCSQVISL